MSEPASHCYGDITRWLLTYFVGTAVFTLLRFLRAPVLRGLNHKVFFNYSISLLILQLLFYTTMFFTGNDTFVQAWKPQVECEAPGTPEQDSFDPTIFLLIMGSIMAFYWLIVAILVQLVLFLLTLWSLWGGIMHATQGLQGEWSMSGMIEFLMRAIGEGEI